MHVYSLFTGFMVGTVGIYLVLHARRQLNGKELRYLKRITVIPSLHWRLGRLKPTLTNQQREGLTDHTQRLRFAISYVFVKQFEPPGH